MHKCTTYSFPTNMKEGHLVQVLLDVEAHHEEFMAGLQWEISPVNIRIGANLHANTETGTRKIQQVHIGSSNR